MLEDFLSERERVKPFRGSISKLERLTGKSKGFCNEVSWGIYNPLPPGFSTAETTDSGSPGLINPTKYYAYRKATRRLFGESFDFPEFTLFQDLTEYFDCNLQQLAKALCLQRSMMEAFDSARLSGQAFFRKEIVEALSETAGPGYCLFLVG